MFSRKYIITLILSLCTTITFSATDPCIGKSCRLPVDKQGNLLPSPNGNLNYIRLPGAMVAEHGEYTWSYLGTLYNKADQQPISFEALMLQVGDLGKTCITTCKTLGLGFHSLEMSFKQDNVQYYIDSVYGGENQVLQSIGQSLDLIESSATLKNFHVGTYPLLTKDKSATWSMQSDKQADPRPPLFKGKVGQPGHIYDMTGSGKTFLWRYGENGKSSVQSYHYKMSLKLVDDRGVVAEGFGGAYVGPPLVSKTPNAKGKTVAGEYEIGQPRLRALSWSVQLTADNSHLPAGFKSIYQFSGNNGLLWGDLGPVKSQPAVNAVRSVIMNNNLINAIALKKPKVANKLITWLNKDKKNWSLYNGNWIAVEFTQGIYKGASMVFVPFWNKTPSTTPPYPDTNDKAWSVNGWADLYTGIIGNDTASAYTVPETLVAGNPEPGTNPPAGWVNPFEIKYLKLANQEKYSLLFPWVRELQVKISANSQMRYALAAYAHRLNPSVVDDPNQPIIINIRTLSPVTQNIFFSDKFTQAYEGAAIATVNGVKEPSWVEQMVS